MIEKFKILGKFVKDLSSETPDVETYLIVKERIGKYQLGIDINSKPLKNKMIEVSTTFKFEDKEPTKKKSHFEIVYCTIIKVDDEVKDKKELAGKFLKDLGNPYSFLLKDIEGKQSVSFGIYGIPESLLINNENIIIKKFVGPLSLDNYKEIKEMIN